MIPHKIEHPPMYHEGLIMIKIYLLPLAGYAPGYPIKNLGELYQFAFLLERDEPTMFEGIWAGQYDTKRIARTMAY